MIGQALPALEGLGAERADKRLFQGATPVPLELQRPVELALTQRARTSARFLQAVPTHVSSQGVFVSKLDPTVGALVRFLSGVASGMCHEPLFLGETFAALGAEVRFGVSQVVSVQHTLQSKRFVTRGTLQRPRVLLLFHFGCASRGACILLDAVFLAYIGGRL